MRSPGYTQLPAGALLAAGDTLGGYRILARRGLSAAPIDPRGLAVAGALYRAEEVSSGLPVTLTVFKREHGPEEPFAQRLIRESKHVSTFVHRNVVSVYEAGLDQGRLYLATQAIDGDTLLDRIRGGGIPAAQALTLLAPLAEALDAAHAVGLVHAEVTPRAIRIDAAGTAHLGAFNVLRRLPGSNVAGVRLDDVEYASPELLCGGQLTGASDVYSLAAVLCHCLTGEVHVWNGSGSPSARLQAWGRRARRLRPGAPALAGVIARGLANDPADRQGQARVLIDEAAKAVASVSWGPLRSAPRFAVQRRRLAFGLVCAAVAAAAALDAETGSRAVPAAATSRAARAEIASYGPLTIRYPRPWRVAPAGVPGAFAVAHSVANAPIMLTSGVVTLAAGPLARSASVPGGVPPQLVRRYGWPVASTARIAGHAARRYEWSRPGGRRVVAFVLPTTGSDLALICAASVLARSLLASCEQLAEAGAVSGVAVLAPGPDAVLATALSHDLAPLGAASGLGSGALPARSAAASRLARLAVRASSLLSRLAPPARSRPALVALCRALRTEAFALADLGVVAAANDRDAYALGRARTLAAGRSLRVAAQSLVTQGLQPPALTALYVVPPAPSPAPSAPADATAERSAAAPASQAAAPASQAAAPAGPPAATAPASSAPTVIPPPVPTRSTSAPPSSTVIVVPTGSSTAAQSPTSPSMVVVVPTN